MPRPHAKTERAVFVGRAAVRPSGGPLQSNECAMMTFNPYFDSPPLHTDKWIPLNAGEININDERELAYWCNELRISIGDLIWLVEKYGTSADRIRALVK